MTGHEVFQTITGNSRIIIGCRPNGVLQLWTDFTYCSGLSVVDFEHVYTSWVMHKVDRMCSKLALKTKEQGFLYISCNRWSIM